MSFNNAYQEGYDHGLYDAQNGIGVRYTRFPKGKAFVFGSDVYDSYCRGYDQGYSDGKAKKAGVYQDWSLTIKKTIRRVFLSSP